MIFLLIGMLCIIAAMGVPLFWIGGDLSKGMMASVLLVFVGFILIIVGAFVEEENTIQPARSTCEEMGGVFNYGKYEGHYCLVVDKDTATIKKLRLSDLVE